MSNISPVRFNEHADYLRNGREIEFVYHSKQYSITNNMDGWQFCCDTDMNSVNLCQFREFDTLVEKIACIEIKDKTIKDIFNQMLYDEHQLVIM